MTRTSSRKRQIPKPPSKQDLHLLWESMRWLPSPDGCWVSGSGSYALRARIIPVRLGAEHEAARLAPLDDPRRSKPRADDWYGLEIDGVPVTDAHYMPRAWRSPLLCGLDACIILQNDWYGPAVQFMRAGPWEYHPAFHVWVRPNARCYGGNRSDAVIAPVADVRPGLRSRVAYELGLDNLGDGYIIYSDDAVLWAIDGRVTFSSEQDAIDASEGVTRWV